jgi:hypothetical protein
MGGLEFGDSKRPETKGQRAARSQSHGLTPESQASSAEPSSLGTRESAVLGALSMAVTETSTLAVSQNGKKHLQVIDGLVTTAVNMDIPFPRIKESLTVDSIKVSKPVFERAREAIEVVRDAMPERSDDLTAAQSYVDVKAEQTSENGFIGAEPLPSVYEVPDMVMERQSEKKGAIASAAKKVTDTAVVVYNRAALEADKLDRQTKWMGFYGTAIASTPLLPDLDTNLQVPHGPVSAVVVGALAVGGAIRNEIMVRRKRETDQAIAQAPRENGAIVHETEA